MIINMIVQKELKSIFILHERNGERKKPELVQCDLEVTFEF